MLGWWLSGQFRRVEKSAQDALDRHEEKDQAREVASLRNFGRIYVALAQRGYPIVLNGDEMLNPPGD
jgi:hypothetical protein